MLRGMSNAHPNAQRPETLPMTLPDAKPSTEHCIRSRSLAKYSKRAAGYDATTGPTWSIRQRTIAALQLRPGQSVLDVGCGTGLSLPTLRAAVGDAGRVYAVDQSPHMLAHAHHRVAAAGWANVHVIEHAAQEVTLPEPVDAMLFHYTHDILRSTAALRQLLACSRVGTRIAIAGVKYFPRWLMPLNLWVYFKNHAYNGAPGHLQTPWDQIVLHLEDWQWTPTQFGMGYLASGRVKTPAAVAAMHATMPGGARGAVRPAVVGSP